MQTAEILREEHRWIRLMLDCLERLVDEARDEGRLDPGATAELLCLLAEFADGEHQRKEEDVLLPLLLTRTSPVDERKIGPLLEQHFQERELLDVLRKELTSAVQGEPPRLTEFMRDVAIYVELHRNHLEEEEAVLLPVVERVLTPDDDLQVVAGFQHVEATGVNVAGVHEQVVVLCHRLHVDGADGP